MLKILLFLFLFHLVLGFDDFSGFFDPSCNRGPPKGYDKCTGPFFKKRVKAWTYNKDTKKCEETMACLYKMGLEHNLFLHEKGCQVWCQFFKEVPGPIWKAAPTYFWDKYFKWM